MIITIDGPTASGKSSAARALAQQLGYYYVYSGLLYRGVAYELIQQYGYTCDTIANADLVHVQELIANMEYRYDVVEQEHIFFKQEPITHKLKHPMIDQAASLVSTNQKVRESVDTWQKEIAQQQSVVVDGRDAGTVVFPSAQYKFFLTASPSVRAKRWQKQQKASGTEMAFADALECITARDARDASRQHAPLKKAQDSITIDNSHLSIIDTVQKITVQL